MNPSDRPTHSYLSLVDTKTIGNRYDVTPLFSDAAGFALLVDDLAAPFRDDPPDAVACIDALGFVLGTAMARSLGVDLLLIRKGGKLPVRTTSESCRDYSGETKLLEIRTDAVTPGRRFLLVDEWIETGAQVRAAARLIESAGGVITGLAAIHMEADERTADLRDRFRIQTVWQER